MVLPDWMRWLILMMLLLLLLIIPIFMAQAATNRERRRARLQINLLKTREQSLLMQVQQLDAQLKKLTNKNPAAEDEPLENGKKVFISYSSNDYEIAKPLRDLLQQNQIPCFMAPESIPAGSNYTKEIPDAICNCFAMVVLLSQSAQDSLWVPKEINMALDENVPVIPFLVDINNPNRQFRFMLGQCQYIQSIKDPNSAKHELISRLKHLQSID